MPIFGKIGLCDFWILRFLHDPLYSLKASPLMDIWKSFLPLRGLSFHVLYGVVLGNGVLNVVEFINILDLVLFIFHLRTLP